MPGVEYVFIGLGALEFVPSPKVHDDDAGAGDEVFVIDIAVPTHAESGEVKSAFTVPIIIGLGFSKVSLQPVEFITISCTE